MERALALVVALILAGCEGVVGDRDLGADPNAQVALNLTSDGDRGQFVPTDMEYTGSVGPYAIFTVTGPSPRLDGPQVRFAGGFAVLRGADTYFTPEMHAPAVTVSLAGLTTADAQMPTMQQVAMKNGCANSVDGVKQLSSEAPLERLSVAVSPAPPVGSLLLLRSVILSGQQPASDQASVCCTNGTCALQ
jgi:hypothetical protein